MGVLLPLLIQLAPILIDLIGKHQGPIQDFLGKLTGGQRSPLGDLLGLGRGAETVDLSPLVGQLRRIADALEAAPRPANPHPVA